MRQYSVILCANVIRDRLEVEIQSDNPDGPPEEVALVYKTAEGWEIDYVDDAFADVRDVGFDAAVARAKELLEEHKDRHDDDPPEGLSAAGMAAWLMEKNEGTEG